MPGMLVLFIREAVAARSHVNEGGLNNEEHSFAICRRNGFRFGFMRSC